MVTPSQKVGAHNWSINVGTEWLELNSEWICYKVLKHAVCGLSGTDRNGRGSLTTDSESWVGDKVRGYTCVKWSMTSDWLTGKRSEQDTQTDPAPCVVCMRLLHVLVASIYTCTCGFYIHLHVASTYIHMWLRHTCTCGFYIHLHVASTYIHMWLRHTCTCGFYIHSHVASTYINMWFQHTCTCGFSIHTCTCGFYIQVCVASTYMHQCLKLIWDVCPSDIIL